MATQATVFPAPVPSRSRQWLQRSLAGLTAATMALAAAGAAYQQVQTAQDRKQFPAPGELVSIGDHRLHIHAMGSHHSGPTIVLESGLGLPSAAWAWVQPEVAEFARVVSYDRAGLGWSDNDHAPVDAPETAEQLYALLKAAEVPGPYILVGHSIGGLFVRQFADLYPDEVAGLVMVDVSHPDQMARLPKPAVDMQLNAFKLYQASPWLARFGILRATNLHGRLLQSHLLPPTAQAAIEAFYSTVGHTQAMSQETQQWEVITGQVRGTGDLGRRPLVVLSGDPAVEPDQAHWLAEWQALHAELAELSTQGEHRLIEGADHNSLLLNSDHAPAVVNAIRDVVAQVQD
ncbi:alpha/beta hydrolase [filamentous cyanobacterium CCP5]|nr:alpha/beta hydrolase [filamentous cyanobacterium CCP5]